MMRFKLLTWDVKDTLLRLRSSVGQQYQAEAKVLGLHVDSSTLNSSFRQAYRDHWRLFPNYGLSQGMSSRQWWLEVVSQTFRLSNVREEGTIRSLAERLYEDFSTAKNWDVLPDAREALRACGELGLRMGVISNFDRRLEEILAQCDLDQHFEFVLTSETAGTAKPDLGIFNKALHLAGVPPQQAAHVGDDYVNDYKAARQAGMCSFLLVQSERGRLEEEVPVDHVIQSLDQVIHRVRQ